MFIERQRQLLDAVRVIIPQDNFEKFHNVIDFVDDNRNISFYPIRKLREASQCVTDEQLLHIVKYFCGAHSKLFKITYCYYDYDDKEVPITAEGYFNALLTGVAPISIISGREIEDFDKNNISFYCNLNVKR